MTDQANYIKDLIEILSADLAPTVAIFGIIIAKLQLKINKERLKHEFFDKRWPQFIAIRDFMRKIRANGKIENDDAKRFFDSTLGCRFIFDKKIKDFVDEIYTQAVLWML